jgi:H/ACA ribonucleoprotein complex subunit 4
MDLTNSVIIINKPCGQTSHEITTAVKKILGVSRSGHAGTLDPNVSGVLPVALGRATKMIQYIAGKEKTYVCLMKFKELMGKKEIHDLFKKYKGTITQTPPKISAVRKVARQRTIHELKILEIRGRFVLFKATVDAGTYIRTLCDDMGKEKGGARMEELRRTDVGGINERDAHTMQDLIDAVWLWKNKKNDGELRKMLRKPEEFIQFKQVVVRENAINELKNGAQLAVPGILKIDGGIEKGEKVALYSEKGVFIGIGIALMDDNEMATRRNGMAVKTERIHI